MYNSTSFKGGGCVYFENMRDVDCNNNLIFEVRESNFLIIIFREMLTGASKVLVKDMKRKLYSS